MKMEKAQKGKNDYLHSLGLVVASILVSFVAFTAIQPEKATEMVSSSKPEETAREIFGVKIEKNPPQSKLDELRVSTWPKYSGEPDKFPWTFKATETMYLLAGKVMVSVEGHEGSFEIGAGDLVVFPKGMKITWDVREAVTKHYSLEK